MSSVFNMLGMNSFHERLTKARSDKGYKHAKEFAAEHGLPYTTYMSHESGDRMPRYDTVKRYAELLSVSLSWLWTGLGGATDPVGMQYAQPTGSYGVADTGYTGRSTSPKSPTQEIAEFLQAYNQLSPTALKSVRQILIDDLLVDAAATEGADATKSAGPENGLSAGTTAAEQGRGKNKP